MNHLSFFVQEDAYKVLVKRKSMHSQESKDINPFCYAIYNTVNRNFNNYKFLRILWRMWSSLRIYVTIENKLILNTQLFISVFFMLLWSNVHTKIFFILFLQKRTFSYIKDNKPKTRSILCVLFAVAIYRIFLHTFNKNFQHFLFVKNTMLTNGRINICIHIGIVRIWIPKRNLSMHVYSI